MNHEEAKKHVEEACKINPKFKELRDHFDSLDNETRLQETVKLMLGLAAKIKLPLEQHIDLITKAIELVRLTGGLSILKMQAKEPLDSDELKTVISVLVTRIRSQTQIMANLTELLKEDDE
jgi:hypothetical protein